MEVGAVAAMRFVKDGIRAAKLVLEHTEHTLLVGAQASIFAITMGLPGPTDLSSPESISQWKEWEASSCQPNFRKNVLPSNGCGPYSPNNSKRTKIDSPMFSGFNSSFPSLQNHDTIAIAVIDQVSLLGMVNVSKVCTLFDYLQRIQ